MIPQGKLSSPINISSVYRPPQCNTNADLPKPPADIPHHSSITCSTEEVFHSLTTLHLKGATCPDEMSSKNAASSDSTNNHFNSHITVQACTQSREVPTYSISQSGNPSDVLNYGSISLLLLSKILGRVHYALKKNTSSVTIFYSFCPGATSTAEVVLLVTWACH